MKKYKMAGALLAAVLCVSSALFGAESSVKPNGCKGPVLCPIFPVYGKCNDCCDYRWHLDVGLLYQQPWMPMSAGMQSTSRAIVQNAGSTSTTNITSYQTAHLQDLEQCFPYSLGVTASVGHLMDHDNWYVGFEFDWISANMSQVFNASNVNYYISMFNTPVLQMYWISTPFAIETSGFDAQPTRQIPGFQAINFNANIDIYALDFIMSRGSYHSRCYSYEPFAGVKALWYNGAHSSRGYNTVAEAEGAVYPTNLTTADYIEWSYDMYAWGVGPMFGFNGEYHLTDGISFFSDSDIAVLYGELRAKYTMQYYLDTAGSSDYDVTNELTAQMNSNQQFFVPVRSILGLKLAKYCLEDKHYVAVKIGYDARYIFANAQPGNSAADVATSGLYVNFLWDF